MGIVERQSIKGTLVSYAGAFIGFLTTFLIITEFLTPKEVGLTRNIVEAATLISSFALLGLNSIPTSIVRAEKPPPMEFETMVTSTT